MCALFFSISLVFPPALFAGAVVVASPEEAVSKPSSIAVGLEQGRLTVGVRNASLKSVLSAVARKADLEIVIRGELMSEPVSFSLFDLHPVEAIRRIVGNGNMLVLYGNDRSVSKIWIYANRAAPPLAKPASGMERLDGLLAELTHSDPGIRENALVDISLLGEDKAVEVLAWMLRKDEASAVRKKVIEELETIQGKAAAGALEPALGDPDPEVRARVIEGIGKIGEENALPLIGQVLFGDKEPLVRLTAVEAISEMSNEAAEAFLSVAADDPDEGVRSRARAALSRWR